jgi:thiamine-phosphate pyrophosphorylase
MDEPMTLVEDRCRLVLIVPQSDDAQKQATEVEDALRGGDVASVIIPQYGLDDAAFQKRAELIVPVVQKAGAAALIAGDSRVAGRVKADGLHVVGNGEALAEAVEKFTPKRWSRARPIRIMCFSESLKATSSRKRTPKTWRSASGGPR